MTGGWWEGDGGPGCYWDVRYDGMSGVMDIRDAMGIWDAMEIWDVMGSRMQRGSRMRWGSSVCLGCGMRWDVGCGM